MATLTRSDIEVPLKTINLERRMKRRLAILGLVVGLLLLFVATYASYQDVPATASPANKQFHLNEPYDRPPHTN